MRRLISGALMTCLALSMAACGGNQATLDALDKCNQDYRTLAERMAARGGGTGGGGDATPAPRLIERATPELYIRAVTEAGYTVVNRTERFIQVDMFGLKVQLFPQETSAQLFAGFSAEGALPAGLTNDWNRTKRFSRAYIDGDGDPVLESDLDLEGGISEAAVVAWVKTFAISLQAFNNVLFQAARRETL